MLKSATTTTDILPIEGQVGKFSELQCQFTSTMTMSLITDRSVMWYEECSKKKNWSHLNWIFQTSFKVKLADLITNFCGLWGMFIGISITTIVEIIYFLVIRQVEETYDYSDYSDDSD